MDRETTLRAVNKSGMPRMTSHTITDMAILEDKFAKSGSKAMAQITRKMLKGHAALRHLSETIPARWWQPSVLLS